jgi:hypothetical protein
MREVIIGAVAAFVVAVITINFLGPKEVPPTPAQDDVQQMKLPNKRFDLAKLRGKDRPFFRRNAVVLDTVTDAGMLR